jgi:hypothetical protein
MDRDVFLATRYLLILKAVAEGTPIAAYNELIRRQNAPPSMPFGFGYTRGPDPKMTPAEEKEWLYWYKVLWPQIEDVINPNSKN